MTLTHDESGRFAGGSYWTGKIGDPRLSGESHWNWKGDNVSYGQLHRWAKKQFPGPMECWICVAKNCRLEMACINKIYTKSESTWARLCVRCHRMLDQHPFSNPRIEERSRGVKELVNSGLTKKQVARVTNTSIRTVERDLKRA